MAEPKEVIGVAALCVAMNAGWVLHAEMGTGYSGQRLISKDHFVLVRGDVRRKVQHRTAITAVTTHRVEAFGEMLPDGTAKFRLQRSKRSTSMKK